MTEIKLSDYRTDFKEYVDKQVQKGNKKPATKSQREYAVDEITQHFEYHDLVLDTEDFYQSVDNIKHFFDSTDVHGSKVACIRAFIKYIEGELSERDAERMRDIHDRFKPSRVDGVSSSRKSNKQRLKEKILSEEEKQAVFSVATFEEKLILKMMLDMGTRPGELAALTPNDINWDYQSGEIGATVHINKTYSQGEGVLDSPKTEDSIRTVNLRQDTVEMLKEFIEEQEISDDELLFNSYRYVFNTVKDVFTFAHVKIGDDSITNYSPHNLRHQTITRLIDKDGYDKETVRKYVGHSSIEITEIYQHVADDEVVGIYG